MFYEPFKTVEEVEPYFGKVVIDKGKKYKIVAAEYSQYKALYIVGKDESGEEKSMPAMYWFYFGEIDGHKFGKEMKD